MGKFDYLLPTMLGMHHNHGIIQQAVNTLKNVLDSNTENHKIYLYLKNPDGTRIALQPGFEIEDYEVVYDDIVGNKRGNKTNECTK